MTRLLCAAVALASMGVPAAAGAQSLGDAARRSEASRKTGGATTLVFDERDLDPALARQEVYAFELDEGRWRRFVRANNAVTAVFRASPGILQRLQALQASSVRSLERFVQREPALVEALAEAGTDPHEYSYTQLALVVAISVANSGSDVLEQAPDRVRANVAFLRARAGELRDLAPRIAALEIRMSAPPAAPRAAAPSAAGAPPAPASDGAGVKGTGPEVPDFTFVDFTGGSRRLSEFRGRYVLLDFWGSWCGPCRSEVPFMKEAYARFQSRGLEVIGMDYEQGASVAEVRAYLQQQGVTWTFATPDSVRDVIVTGFQVSSFPTLVLLDPEGRIIAAPTPMLRREQLARTLDRILPR